ncbi:MAG: hypothetical protein AB1758_37725 [Candidatus Eremiobacterota bacterium]
MKLSLKSQVAQLFQDFCELLGADPPDLRPPVRAPEGPPRLVLREDVRDCLRGLLGDVIGMEVRIDA